MAARSPRRATLGSPPWASPPASAASRRCIATTPYVPNASRPNSGIRTRPGGCGGRSTAPGLRETSSAELLDGGPQARRVQPLLDDLLEAATVAALVCSGAAIAGPITPLEQPGAEACAEARVDVLALGHEHEPALADAREAGLVYLVER